jgi:hypothetical protein
MVTNKIETLEEVMKEFEKKEEISEVILLGVGGKIRRVILK